MKPIHKLIFIIVIGCALMLILSWQLRGLVSPKEPHGSVPLATNWEYRYGDSPFAAPNQPIWASGDTDHTGWSKLQDPTRPLPQDGHYLWLKVKLPAVELRDPVLYAQFYQLFEVYSEQGLLYRFGNMEPALGRVEYVGTPHRLIPLPDDAIGSSVYFRIYSEGKFVGPMGNVLLGERADFVSFLFTTQTDKMLFGFLYICIGLISLMVYLRHIHRQFLLSFAIFAAFMGAYCICRLNIVYFFYDDARFWMYAELTSLIFGIVGGMAFCGQMFGSVWKPFMGIIWKVQLVVGCGILLASALHWATTPELLLLYQILLIGSLLSSLLYTIVNAWKGSQEARVIVLGIVVIGGLGLADILKSIYFSQLNSPIFIHMGMLVFMFSMMYVLFGRIFEMFEAVRTTEKLSLVGQLAAGIAHEIKNPVTVVSGFLQLIKKNPANTRHVDLMLSEMGRINSIATEFLMLAKPADTPFHPEGLDAILQEVLVLLGSMAEAKDVSLHLHTEQQGLQVWCEPSQLKQVFINIIKNGIEAMEQGGDLQINSFPSMQDSVCIRFADQGMGFPKEMKKKIGQPFFTTKEKGTGLGMMVSNRIVALHGGRIEVSSKPGNGTVFEVHLPLHSAAKH